ncbi:alkaline phosphatase [Allisonella histaminiformans]|uniref:alkaline phosphatase n=1 Tax=Allisonella histaminiformans TaxID=209880 RepID=UPI002943D5CC|nr:alkaline phosphatase [Allisonella histaminiformans]
MKKTWLKRAVLSMVVLGSVTGMVSSVQAADVRILPIDNAKFLAGARFDFDVEVSKAENLKHVDITINNQPADKFFGKELKVTDLDNGVISYRVNDVDFSKVGSYTVQASATDDTGRKVSQARYTVVKDKAQRQAKNVILFVGDGMSLQAREMARILSKGMTNGKYNDLLAMEKMPHNCLITTSGYDSLTTDSANSASAYATGHKSVVNAMGVYEDSTADPFDDPRVENITEIVKRSRGMSVGIITQAESTDATPAAMVGHTRRRANQDYLASEYLEDYHRPDVIMGGGLQRYIPQGEEGSKRHDNQNVVQEFKDKGYTYATTSKEMMAAPSDKPLLGLFHKGTMNVYIDREMLKNPEVLGKYTDQPNLVNMTKKSLDILSRNPNGFFAMIEGASIDKQLHAMDWQRATYDTIEFDKAVEYAQKWNKEHGDNTLIIVVADHAHGASITGTYHERDGKKGLAAVRTYADSIFPTFKDANHDGFPDNPDPDVTLAIQYANHPAYYENFHFQQKPTEPTITETVSKQEAQQVGDKTEYHQVSTVIAKANPARHHEGDPVELIPANIPDTIGDECHAADDVPLNAEGPGSEYFNGVMDNTEVFFGIMRALGMDATKTAK